jgi:hypothetical protein
MNRTFSKNEVLHSAYNSSLGVDALLASIVLTSMQG